MDRDKRWERVKIAVDGLTSTNVTEGSLKATDAADAISKVEEKYKENITDEFLKPIIIGGEEGRIKGMSYREYLRAGQFTVSLQ
jgi:2,3-bisphosphoglycerate-independent phosphoglycerate mutase